MSNVGQIIGGTKNILYVKEFDEMFNSKGNKILQRTVPLKNVIWYSKQFKIKYIGEIHPINELVGFLSQ